MNTVNSVDEHIENSPQEAREKLRQIRKIIKKVSPNSEEKISYGMPYYGYCGRLVYFIVRYPISI